MIDYQEYFKLGYTCFKLEDVLTDEELIEFKNIADQTCDTELKDEIFQYTFSIQGIHNDNPEFPWKIPVSEVAVKKKRAKELDYTITQQWYESLHWNHNHKNYFEKFIKTKFIRNFYPEVKENFSNLQFESALTLYLKDDFIDIHRDGQNPGRLCAVLIYLTPSNLYEESMGGRLMVAGDEQPNKNFVPSFVVNPVRGNIVMLDFTQHNPFHAVEKVFKDFKRFCFITFLWDKDKR